ncbi:2-hydroxyhepta-2,4-diene-1,7-dioate isomerase [Cercophora newfieldiana]|uniref:2-hydroxyhepta-2,4-diene-1,7-dioate isomerase n=1 Tax=Cercophora newfieldiana TaxID=92897 RepID=A0AA39Y8C4_9PEZI|nr:2-hydroxyhepta-2,4-diene-1,7-dioate isomerase [Cercophora newfieldiana]
MAVWDSLIRFQAPGGKAYWAALPLDAIPTTGQSVQGYSTVEDLESGSRGVDVTVEKLLAPVPATGIPIICVGLNYRNHANEASLPIPATPPMWYKPAASLAEPDSEVAFPQQAQKSFPDFEGELTIVLRNSIKNITAAEAPSQILGYTIGNDLTARHFQRSCGGQYTYAKGFDRFAPLGPRLVHPSHITPDARGSLTTRVNGRTVQNSPFDFIFPVDELLSFLSQGTTIPAGTAILTGTPAGVGWFQDPKCPLKDGDVVEVEIKPIGVLKTKVVFE